MPDPSKVYTGKSCKRGHDGTRWKCNNGCVTCELERNHRDYTDNPEYRERKQARMAAYNERMYHGEGPESFVYRASRAMRSRRHLALARMAKRNEERRSLGAL